MSYTGRLAVALMTLAGLAGCTPSPHDLAAADDDARLEALLKTDELLVDSQGPGRKRPLHYAATHGALETIALLVRYKADVDARDETGLAPLHCAAMWDRVDAAQALLDAGAKLEAEDAFQDTPLHLAAMHDRVRMIEFLVERGAYVHALNKNGKSPLDLAVEQRKAGAATVLREAAKNAPPPEPAS